MKTLKKRKNKTMLETAHNMAQGLYDAGVIDSLTMREFDSLCLPSVKKLTSRQIKLIRLREKMSQSVFARFLNISPSIVKQWEQGEKHPKGTSLKLLNLITEKGIFAIF